MPKPKIFLFHGNDALMSRRSLQKWEQVFITKHSDMSHHRIFLDDGSLPDARAAIQQAFTEQSLFQTPVLCVIYRPTAQEKGRTGVFSQVLLDLLTPLIKGASPEVTVLIWEGKRLAENHSIKQWFQEHETRGLVKEYEFTVPAHRELLDEGRQYLAEQGYTLSPEAFRLLDSSLMNIEKEQRATQRLRGRELPVLDTRRWWLWNVLDTALLSAPDENINEKAILYSIGDIARVVTPFEIVNLCDSQQWKQARDLIKHWEIEGNEANYFILTGLLRQRFETHRSQVHAQYACQLLAEIELLGKNGIAPMSWLFEVFFIRMEKAQVHEPLITPRTVWLSVQ